MKNHQLLLELPRNNNPCRSRSNQIAPSAKARLEFMQLGLSAIPNLIRVAANSPAGLDALVGLNGALAKGRRRAAVRESIAPDVARLNTVAGTEIDFPAVPAAARGAA